MTADRGTFATGEEFRSQLRSWIADNLPDDGYAELDFAARVEIDKLLAKGGWIGYTWPTEFGGGGGGPVEGMVLDEELARAGYPRSMSPSLIGVNLLGPTLMVHGTQEQRAQFLPRILSVEDIWCQGFSEPQAGSDLANVKSVAVNEGDHLTLNGSKIWTTRAQYANWCFLLAVTDREARRHRNLSMMMVPMNSPGIEVQPLVTMLDEPHFSQVFFENVRIEADNVIGALGEGWAAAMTTLSSERSYGQMSKYRHFDSQVQRLAKLIAGGSSNALYGSWVQRLGRVHADVEAIRDLSFRIVSTAITGGDPGEFAAPTKLWWSHTHQRLAALGWSVASSLGVDEDYWYWLWLESRGETIYAGASQIQRNIISDRTLGLPR